MEGVPERMGLPDMTSGKRRLHEGHAADGDSPIEGVKGQKGRQVIPCSLAKCQANIAYVHLRRAGLFWSLPSCQTKEMSRMCWKSCRVVLHCRKASLKCNKAIWTVCALSDASPLHAEGRS